MYVPLKVDRDASCCVESINAFTQMVAMNHTRWRQILYTRLTMMYIELHLIHTHRGKIERCQWLLLIQWALRWFIMEEGGNIDAIIFHDCQQRHWSKFLMVKHICKAAKKSRKSTSYFNALVWHNDGEVRRATKKEVELGKRMERKITYT